MAMKHKGHATRAGFRNGTRGMNSPGGSMASDMPMAGGAPSTTGSENLAPGETQSMPAPMGSGMGDDAGAGMAGGYGPDDGAAPAFRRGGRVRG